MPSIARKNLFEDIPRFLIAQAGIVFAVSLVTIQGGILRGFMQSASLLVDRSTADLWVVSEDMVNLQLTLPLPYDRAVLAREVPGVARVETVMLGGALWRDRQGTLKSVVVVGSDPNGQLFRPWNLREGSRDALNEPYTAIVDRTSLDNLSLSGLDDTGTLRGIETRIVGIAEGTQSMVFSPFAFVSLETANTYLNALVETSTVCQVGDEGQIDCTNRFERVDRLGDGSTEPPPLEPITATTPVDYLLIEAAPDANLATLKSRLEAALPDVKAYTREELSRFSQEYWRQRTGIGFVLTLGAAVGVVVGIAIVGQILYASTSERLREFGTLKAMGASDWTLRRVIVEQALWMAVLGYLPGMALCWGVARWALAAEGIVIAIAPLTAGATFVVTSAMCVGSALFAIQKVNRVDPAIVFKA